MANVTRWNPVRDMIQLREAMDRMFDDTLYRREYREKVALPIDAYVTADDIVLVADVPGLKPEDISITLEKDTLTIKGEFKPAEVNNYLVRERVTGKFERVLTINTPVDFEKVDASFENGVLTLRLPKAEAAKPRQITVKPNHN
jgi:HSP20 family protein